MSNIMCLIAGITLCGIGHPIMGAFCIVFAFLG